jgi:hypothetical protein
VIDLEELLIHRQNQLRGRPEDWIDRFGGWRRRIDWVDVALLVAPVAMLLMIAGMALL